MNLDDNQALNILKASQQVPDFIKTGREESAELFALTQGDNFIELLITRVEHVESKEKQKARKKYSRDITHFYERLLRPVDNVYTATGGSKDYSAIDNKDKQAKLLKKVSRTRDGKSLQEWLKSTWMPLYHADPNGVVFMEYKGGDNAECWPTYKNIEHIRNYQPKGQLVDWILFEPKKIKTGKVTKQLWRLVDDLTDRTYIEDGGNFTIVEELTFEHPFGQAPAIINSDIEKLKANYRLSPIDKIVEVSKEYARDQSIKTIYKKYHGFPIMWKYENQCKQCFGAKKREVDGQEKTCPDCEGHGYYKNKDVTDVMALKIPEGDETKLAPDIAGYIQPSLETWGQYNTELDSLYATAYATHWGTLAGSEQSISKTATEIILSSQPIMERLSGYSDVAEFKEAQLTNWFYNFQNPDREDKDVLIANIHYGRRFIIDPPDIILEKYEKAKEAGDNNVILDRLLNEYFTAKYQSDPEHLRIILLKANVEPYIHLTLEQVGLTFGSEEAQKKVLFEDWWKTLTKKDKDKTAEQLKIEFDTWFKAQLPQDEETDAATLENQAKLRGSVGGVTGIIAILAGVSQNQIPKDSAISILEAIYGLSKEVAIAMIGSSEITGPTTGPPNKFN